MMGKKAGRKHSHGCSLALLVAVFGLSACVQAQKPVEHAEPPKERDQLEEVKLIIDADGNLSAIDKSGKRVDEPCSTNPKAKNVCPLFKPGHKVEVKEITNVSIVRYKGSNCVTYMWTDTLGRARSTTVCY